MKSGQKSNRGGYQDILCPFTNLYISQGSGGNYSHKGLKAIDVTNGNGVRAAYYAPFDCKVVMLDKPSCTVIWQSINKVRFADGTVDYATMLTCHDESINYGVGFRIGQGYQIGNMGAGGNAKGIHCHIEMAKGHQTGYYNSYKNYGLRNSCEVEEAWFMDNTNIILGIANWKYLKDVPVSQTKYLNINKTIAYRSVYKNTNLVKANKIGEIKPSKFGGLSYKIYEECDNQVVKIRTGSFGDCYISAKAIYGGSITTSPTYPNGNY